MKYFLDRVSFFQFEGLLDDVLIHFCKFDESNELKVKDLILADKFYIGKQFWKNLIEDMYHKYLPQVNYSFNWEIETTPYSFMLCRLMSSNIYDNDYIKRELEKAKINYDRIDNDFDNLKNDFFISDLLNQIPVQLLPEQNVEKIRLLIRVMDFPPLSEIARFIVSFNSYYKKSFADISSAFSIIEQQFPEIRLQSCLHLSFYHFNHSVLSGNGIDKLISDPGLSEYKNVLLQIKREAPGYVEINKGNAVCPCCGGTNEISLPNEAFEYLLITKNSDLSKKIGFIHFNDFVDAYKESFNRLFTKNDKELLRALNTVDNPQCIILVEGESEEYSIPILTFRNREILSLKSVFVYNCKSKSKLWEAFLSYKDKFPTMKIICLLDSDGVTERDGIARIVKDKKDKYAVFFIDRGTYEDIFPLDLAVKVLNKLFPEGADILKSDFNPEKTFLQNAQRILHEKKNASFDKVKFAIEASFKIDIEETPQLVKDIIEKIKVFMDKTIITATKNPRIDLN